MEELCGKQDGGDECLSVFPAPRVQYVRLCPALRAFSFFFQIFRGGTAGRGPAQQDHAEQMEARLINSTPASPERKHLRVLLI